MFLEIFPRPFFRTSSGRLPPGGGCGIFPFSHALPPYEFLKFFSEIFSAFFGGRPLCRFGTWSKNSAHPEGDRLQTLSSSAGHRGGSQRQAGVLVERNRRLRLSPHEGGMGQRRDVPIPGQSPKYTKHFQSCLPSDKPHLKQTQYKTNVIEKSRVRLADNVNAVEEQITNYREFEYQAMPET